MACGSCRALLARGSGGGWCYGRATGTFDRERRAGDDILGIQSSGGA